MSKMTIAQYLEQKTNTVGSKQMQSDMQSAYDLYTINDDERTHTRVIEEAQPTSPQWQSTAIVYPHGVNSGGGLFENQTGRGV